MPEFEIPELLRSDCLTPFGISARDALEAVRSPDETHIVRNAEGKTVATLYKRLFPHPKPARYLLALVVLAGDKEQFDWVAKIYPKLADGLDGMPPLEMLKVFVERFGLPISVGSARGKFILETTIPVTTTNIQRIITVEAPDNRDYTAQVLAEFKDKPTPVVECSIGFAIDYKRYLNWLKGVEKR